MEPPATTSAAEQVLEQTWDRRRRAPAARARRARLAAALLFLAAAAALLLLAPPSRPLAPVVAVALVFAYAVAARVEMAVGAGYAVPTQVVLVPMLLVLPPAAAPCLVAAGLALSTLADRRRSLPPGQRLVLALGDATHALGPAAVLVALGSPGPGLAALGPLVLAMLAQCAADFAAAAGREAVVHGIRPREQLAVMGQVWRVDALLWPVGLVLARGIADVPASVVALLPLLVLLQWLVTERNARLEQAQDRLGALRTERSRLQGAVRRIGDAFACGTDVAAVLTTTAATIREALSADATRVTLHRDGRVAQEAGDDTGERSAVCRAASGELALAVRVVHDRAELSADELELCSYLLERALLSVEHAERQRRLYAEAQTDELTGLANYRRLQRVLDEGVRDHERLGAPVSLLLLDLDDFKQVNDRHGHQTGDLVLQTVSLCLQGNARRGDLAARYGGEELAVVAAAGPEEAQLVAHRLADAIRALRVPVRGGERIGVTASFGVATLGGSVATKEALIGAADEALYRAKRTGKNRVEAAPAAEEPAPLPALGPAPAPRVPAV